MPQIPGLYKRVLDSLTQIPGVTSAAATTDPELMDSGTGLNITVAGYTEKEEEDMDIEKEVVSPGYFSTLGMPLIVGRGIGEQDGPDAAPVAVVNETFAKHWFGSAANAIGHQFHDGGGNPPKDVKLQWLTIVGVVKDAKHSGDSRGRQPNCLLFVPAGAAETRHSVLCADSAAARSGDLGDSADDAEA